MCSLFHGCLYQYSTPCQAQTNNQFKHQDFPPSPDVFSLPRLFVSLLYSMSGSIVKRSRLPPPPGTCCVFFSFDLVISLLPITIHTTPFSWITISSGFLINIIINPHNVYTSDSPYCNQYSSVLYWSLSYSHPLCSVSGQKLNSWPLSLSYTTNVKPLFLNPLHWSISW